MAMNFLRGCLALENLKVRMYQHLMASNGLPLPLRALLVMLSREEQLRAAQIMERLEHLLMQDEIKPGVLNSPDPLLKHLEDRKKQLLKKTPLDQEAVRFMITVERHAWVFYLLNALQVQEEEFRIFLGELALQESEHLALLNGHLTARTEHSHAHVACNHSEHRITT